ncbi:MAG: lipocalin family protein [Polaribacter sp.]
MKKLLYLFIASAILFSCESNDEDGSLSGGDPIIGKWQLTSIVENGNEIATSCDKKSNATFSSNGTVVAVFYYESNSTNCESESSSLSWENLGNSNYKIFGNGDESTAKVNFTQNNTVMSSTTSDGSTTYIETYKRE